MLKKIQVLMPYEFDYLIVFRSITSDRGTPASAGSWQKLRCSCFKVAFVRSPLQRLTAPKDPI